MYRNRAELSHRSGLWWSIWAAWKNVVHDNICLGICWRVSETNDFQFCVWIYPLKFLLSIYPCSLSVFFLIPILGHFHFFLSFFLSLCSLCFVFSSFHSGLFGLLLLSFKVYWSSLSFPVTDKPCHRNLVCWFILDIIGLHKFCRTDESPWRCYGKWSIPYNCCCWRSLMVLFLFKPLLNSVSCSLFSLFSWVDKFPLISCWLIACCCIVKPQISITLLLLGRLSILSTSEDTVLLDHSLGCIYTLHDLMSNCSIHLGFTVLTAHHHVFPI